MSTQLDDRPSLSDRLTRFMPMLLPLALLVLLLEVFVLARLLGREEPAQTTQQAPATATALPTVAAPLAPRAPTAAPTKTAAPPAVAKPQQAAPQPAPPPAPPTEAPAASAAPAPPPPAPPPPAARPGPAPPSAVNNTPTTAVQSFYHFVERGSFEQARQLWTQRMQRQYPPAENIWSRFAQTQRIAVQRAELVALDQPNGRATVAVDLVEVLESGATRRYTGNWYLVRGPNGWLLDQPSIWGS